MRASVSVAISVSLLASNLAVHANPIEMYDLCRKSNSAIEKIQYCSVAILESKNPTLLERAHNRRGFAYMELNKFAEAAQDFTAVIRLDPKIAGYYDNRQNALRSMGRLSEALDDANTAVHLAPTYSFVYRGRGVVYDAMGQESLAIKDFNSALAIDPRNIGLHIDRGKILAKSGFIKEAINDFSTALEIDPKATGALKERGLVYKKAGDAQAALSDLILFARLEPADEEVNQAIQDIRSQETYSNREDPPKPRQSPKSSQMDEPKGASSGTGFLISSDGYFVTNAHVIDGCHNVQVVSGHFAAVPARIVARDVTNDLALLQANVKSSENIPSLRSETKIGENIAVFGFPLNGLLASRGNFTVGNVSAIAGLNDDTRYLQISAPVQPGNSGGPVLDNRGNVVGVVVGKLDAIKVASVVNDLAQNVNFAIKTSILKNFLDANGVGYSSPISDQLMQPADLAERARSMSLFIECE